MSEQVERIAPAGFLWVCHACGKTEQDRYGQGGGWDESCMLNSALHAVEELNFSVDGKHVIRIGNPEKIAIELSKETLQILAGS